MGKAAKRERQKTNRQIKSEHHKKAQSRKQFIGYARTFIIVAIIPAIVAIALFVNKATNKDKYVAKVTVAIEGVKSLPNNGVIDIELNYAHAPKSVEHFVGFASNGYYNGLTWHRVVKDFVIQGGDPKGDGSGSLGRSIVAELPREDYVSGDVAWAKAGNEEPGTAGSQFFIITGKDTSENVKALSKKEANSQGKQSYQYGIIGHVTKGLGAAVEIEKLARPKEEATDGQSSDAPSKKAIIKSIEIYKNGKLMKSGDVTAPTTSPTTSTTSAQQNTPAEPQSSKP